MPLDLAVYYRIYPGKPTNREFYDGDKLSLAAVCLYSFVLSCSRAGLEPSLCVLLDGCPPSWADMVRHIVNLWSFPDWKLVELGGIGNKESFLTQFDMALEDNPEYVYFAEDDYLYRPHAMFHMMHFAKSAYAFWQPYDHLDRYVRDDNRDDGRVTMQVVRDHHWRTVESACMTYGAPIGLLRGVEEYVRWHACTGRHFWYPVLDMGLTLWAPVPSLATHLECGHIAPCLDWGEILRVEVLSTFPDIEERIAQWK